MLFGALFLLGGGGGGLDVNVDVIHERGLENIIHCTRTHDMRGEKKSRIGLFEGSELACQPPL